MKFCQRRGSAAKEPAPRGRTTTLDARLGVGVRRAPHGAGRSGINIASRLPRFEVDPGSIQRYMRSDRMLTNSPISPEPQNSVPKITG